MKSAWLSIAAGALLAAGPTSPLSAADVAAWRIGHGEVRVTCPLTVGGSFEARTTSIAGMLQPASGTAALAGEIAVDLRTLDAGIGLRTEHMRDNYLEVGKGEGFQSAVLSDIHLLDLPADASQGRTRFAGTLLLHGTKKPVEGTVDIRREAGGARVEAAFPIALADYGIAPPRYLGVGVKNEVQVKASLTATSGAR